MFVLSTICMAFAFFVLITKTITFTRKFRLFLLQISSGLFRNEGGMEKMPFRTRLVDIICTAAIVMVILSQFTHWYYHPVYLYRHNRVEEPSTKRGSPV